MTFIGKIRLRLFAFIIGVPLAAFGAISLGPSWLALPVVGVAFYALTLTVNKTASRLAHSPACWTCGVDLRERPVGEHGVACPSCGTLNLPLMLEGRTPAGVDEDEASSESDDDGGRSLA